MKPAFRVHYVSSGGYETSLGFESREEAVKFIYDTVNSGGRVTDIKQNEKVISAKSAFRLIREAGLQIIKRPASS